MRAVRALLLCCVALAPLGGHAQGGSYAPLFGVRFGGAQRQSSYVGIERVTHESSEGVAGNTLELEVGRSAGQVGVGRSSFGPMTPIFRLQAVGMRSWKRATDVAPGQTFVGAELQIALFVGASYAYYWRVAGEAPGQERYHALRLVVGI